ncbi:diaminopimelate epimerase [Thermobrachium celere]|uniref:diaminopimelate epimerase n=1 Tax=Thermobrachium celere TaxID=53422 RepID=UPI0019456F0C|nr:diaminopimelate epimerase [Thermobrachium celere]GFR35053.1 diaminopimelate epimerase [Thermobrachium celere]
MNFVKMHGLGNDFIIFEALDKVNYDWNEIAKKVCDRHIGIGADGILIVENSDIADVKMVIINSDGSYAEMCGNGLRCFSKYVYERGIVKKEILNIETGAGVLEVVLKIENGIVKGVRVNMGKPILEEDKNFYKLNVLDRTFNATTMIMGVPHTVIYVDEIKDEDVIKYGPIIEKMDMFKRGTNVNFVKIIDDKHIQVRTWERGAGYTLACGTGTCASVVASYINNFTDKNVIAHLKLGDLRINYEDYVYMEGPAEFICEGRILL